MGKRQKSENHENQFKEPRPKGIIGKDYLVVIIAMNIGFYFLFKGWGNLLFAGILGFILFLWCTPGRLPKLKKTLREWCLGNTWLIMRIMMKFSRNKKHPWKKNPPSYKDWIINATPIGEDYAYIITLTGALVISAIGFGTLKGNGIL